MRFFPRSLLWRTVLLVALLMVAGHLSWLQLFRVSEREPRAQEIAQQITSVINLTRSALITSSPDKRLALLDDLARQEGIQVYVDQPNEPVQALPDLPFATLIKTELKANLGADTELARGLGPSRALWVSFKIDEEEYWVRLTRERIERQVPWRWIGWGIFVLLLSIGGAFLTVARINRPLRELTRASELIGQGKTPSAIGESGPSEIQTLARAFNQMNNDLQRHEEDRALLLAGVSHDLRTPLARIRLGVEMLDSSTDESLKEGMVQDIQDIDAVINQFLDFARTTSELSSTSDTDLNEIVTAVVERYQRYGKSVQARLGSIPHLPLKVPAIQRLLTNLVDNALRHASGEVEIATAATPTHVTLSVLDRGPGIPPTEAERMLQPFTRMNEARSVSGSGLGLAIVDRIAKLHGGTIKLLPREGGGLEARVELPIETPNATTAAPAA